MSEPIIPPHARKVNQTKFLATIELTKALRYARSLAQVAKHRETVEAIQQALDNLPPVFFTDGKAGGQHP